MDRLPWPARLQAPSPTLSVVVGTARWPQHEERTQLEPLYLFGEGNGGWENWGLEEAQKGLLTLSRPLRMSTVISPFFQES